MRKSKLLVLGAMFALATPMAHAECDYCAPEESVYDYTRVHQWAVQGTFDVANKLFIGISNYTNYFEWGVSAGGKITSQNIKSSNVTPFWFADLRAHLANNTVLAYGFDGSFTFGENNGHHINSDWVVSTRIALEQYLTQSVILTGWINPNCYIHTREGGVTNTVNTIFSTGGIALSYVFS